jgi:hypothetical protein
MCIGERPTLLAAQLAIEAQAHEFAAKAATPVQPTLVSAPTPIRPEAPRRRPGDTDRDLFLRLTTAGSAA